MADSIRERIVLDLVAAVQGVRKTSGYELDVQAVDRARRTKYQQHELPAVNVWEVKEKKEAGPSGLVTCYLSLLLEITVLDLRQQAALSNQAMAATIKAVLADRQRSGLAVDTEEGENTTFTGETNDPTGGVRVGIEIEYRHKEDDPYAQL
jgi:hypothetical protein